jgi:uncharacterized membrane protein YkvA (DUF1232 family)
VLLRIGIGVAGALLLAWLLLIAYLLVHRPAEGTMRESLRLLPDTVRLLRRIAADRGLPGGVRARLWLLLGYLAFPIDLVPDFLPVVGYADDVVIVGVALRSVVRSAGPGAVRRHWPGTDDGLQALWSAAGLPGAPPPPTA